MLASRVIPCLLVRDKGLVKTVKFKNEKYLGDPLNAVKIFNEKEVDELIVLDIDASTKNKELDYKMIENLASECRMPLCYGGGIKTVEQAEKILGLGVEKVALSSIVFEDIEIINKISNKIGAQSVVIVLDVRKRLLGNDYDIFTHNGKNKIKYSLIEFLKILNNYPIGEIVINSIDHDGVMTGYDYKMIRIVKNYINTPLTVLGGAGSLEDIRKLIDEFGIIGAAAGSLFVFKGKYKAVLINYAKPS